MRFVTNLMDRIFSDSTPEEFKDKVSEKIDEAKANGSAELKEGDDHLSFAESNGDVVIEDKKHDNEVTVAKEDNGEYKLEGVPTTKTESATEPDAKAEIPSGETKKPLKPDDTLEDVNSGDIKAAIINEDKAGVGKHFSLKFEGFDSEEAAQQFYSDLCMEDEVISFSDAELLSIADQANELRSFSERVEGTGDPALALELQNKAESLKAYSILASNQGYEMNDLYEIASAYSDYADEVLTQAYSDMDVNEYFSEMDEDEINAYFSGLDEIEANVLYSALTDEDNNYTFSEVQDAINDCYSEIELDTPVNEYFSEMDEDEINAYFSNLTDQELNTVYSVLEENEDATFSDLNEAIELNGTPMTELFSDMDEEELNTYSEQVGDEIANIAFSMALDQEENYTYSDFLDVVEYMSTYSEEDVEQLSKNADEIGKAAEDMKSTNDPELAKKVKVLADATAEEAETAKEQGVEGASEVCDKCHSYSDAAEEVLVKKGINPKSIDIDKVFSDLDKSKESASDSEFDTIDTNKDGYISKEELEAYDKNLAAKFDAIDTNKDGKISKQEFEAMKAVKNDSKTKAECDKSYSYLFGDKENRTFSSQEEGTRFGTLNDKNEVRKSINPCLFSVIN